MSDSVLLARLQALLDDLGFVKKKLQSTAWLSEQRDPRAEMLVELLWTGLEATLIKDIERQEEAIRGIQNNVTQPNINAPVVLAHGWNCYAKAFQASQSILRECLEIIGMLAIRSNNLDEQSLHVADELISECLTASTGDPYYYLLVNGMEDTFTKTRSRILRLRFPEWTIWELPMTVHELGHVVISERLSLEKAHLPDDRVLEPFIQRLGDALIGLEQWDQQIQAGELSATEAGQWAEGRVHEFLADAFAVYTMGPAYACSAILLRLNPALEAAKERPSDAQRAQLILSMLDWANTKSALGPYERVVDRLQIYWNETLGRVNPADKPTPAYETWLSQLAKDFGENAARKVLLTNALYPFQTAERGWLHAQTWVTQWLHQLGLGSELTAPDIPAEHIRSEKLRDVLNAVWYCRLLQQAISPADPQARQLLRDLEKIGRELGNSIVASRRSPTQLQIPAPSRGVRP